MFGSEYEMPPVADFEKGDENEYRCPYIPSCPAGANCFAVATPEPLQEKEILNVSCRLCGNRKIPIYAGKAQRSIKKQNIGVTRKPLRCVLQDSMLREFFRALNSEKCNLSGFFYPVGSDQSGGGRAKTLNAFDVKLCS